MSGNPEAAAVSGISVFRSYGWRFCYGWYPLWIWFMARVHAYGRLWFHAAYGQLGHGRNRNTLLVAFRSTSGIGKISIICK